MNSASIARVLIDSPLPQLDRLLDYAIPQELADSALPGVRVTVPLRTGRRLMNGYLVEIADSAAFEGKLSAIESVVSPAKVLPAGLYQLARKVADRAAGSASDVLRLAIPKRQVKVENAWLEAGSKAAQTSEATAATIRNFDEGQIKRLIQSRGRAALEVLPGVVKSGEHWVGSWAFDLAEIASSGLAFGSVIICVPDYRDLEQVLLAAKALLPEERILRVDSGQSDRLRYRAFLDCLSGPSKLIIGNRSAVYAPASDLAMIIVWNDGDPLLREPLAPYVHPRDAALIRQELQEPALVFAGLTRTTQAERLVEIGWLEEVSPLRRNTPRVILTANQLSGDPLPSRARIPTLAWQEVSKALKSGPALIQTALPGYVTRLNCEHCGEPARCRQCAGPLELLASGAIPSCRVCGAISANWECPNCGRRKLRRSRLGAERTAEDLGKAFPGIPVVVADGQRPLTTVDSSPKLVIATRGAEPIASGGYQVVLILDGERQLLRESLNVAEDCLRQWTTAISLAAPGAPSIITGVTGSLGAALATWRLTDQARAELIERTKLRFPPSIRVAVVRGPKVEVVALATELERMPGVDILGPSAGGAGETRIVVRFEYGAGASVSAAVRSALVKSAIEASRTAKGRSRLPSSQSLRARFDDPDVFDSTTF